MEDKILKQIESEALKLFPLDEYDDELFSERYNWRNGAKFGYNIKDSVDVDWKKLRDEYFDEHVRLDTGCYIHITTSAHDLFEWFKSKLSASQNTESNEGEWISVKDMLPEKEGHYLVYCPKSFPKNYRAVVGEFYDDNKTFYSESSDSPIEDATHWCYIPTIEPINPPKEK